MKWKVCPIQGRQLKDVRPEDIYGDFRICKTYRSGGGYDQLARIIERRGVRRNPKDNIEKQFVVQLFGCHLRCPYCYVTRDGIFGSYIEYASHQLAYHYYSAYAEHDVGVFHLMGGAPALYIEHWPDLIGQLDYETVFHSDLLLTEKLYDRSVLTKINKPNTIYAVNIKGLGSEDYFKNTGRVLTDEVEKTFWSNMRSIIETGLNFYITFTNPDVSKLHWFKNLLKHHFGSRILEDSFVINLVNYKALEDGDAF